MDGWRRVRLWELADVVAGGRNHHSLSVREMIRVSLRSCTYNFGFDQPRFSGHDKVAYKNVKMTAAAKLPWQCT